MISKDEFSKLRKEFLSDAEAGVKKVLAGEIDEYKNPFLCGDDYLNILKSNGIDPEETDCGIVDYNGWAGDYWLKWIVEGKAFGMMGSAIYGGTQFYRDPHGDD